MGTVYLARRESPAQDVAIKILDPEVSPNLEFLKRFQSSLRHPNIVEILDVGSTSDANYLVMEYFEGSDLQALMASPQRPDWYRALEIGIQVFDALEHAHRHGVIHRNIKPSNVLINAAGQAVLSDFSLSPLREGNRSGNSSSGALIGAPEYKAPEQFDSVNIDSRADIYSASLLLYELLTAFHPFRRKTMPEIVRAQLFTMPATPDTYNPDIPLSINDLIMKGLAKKPTDRPLRAGEVADQLRRDLSKETRPAAPPPGSPPPPRPAQSPITGSPAPMPPRPAAPARDLTPDGDPPRPTRERMSVLLIRFTSGAGATNPATASGSISTRELRDRLSYLLRRSSAEALQWSSEGATVLFNKADDALRCARSVYNDLEDDRFSLKMAIATGEVFFDPNYADRSSLGEFPCRTVDIADQAVRDCPPGTLRLDATSKIEADSTLTFASQGDLGTGVEIYSLVEPKEDGTDKDSAAQQPPMNPFASLKAEREGIFKLPSGGVKLNSPPKPLWDSPAEPNNPFTSPNNPFASGSLPNPFGSAPPNPFAMSAPNAPPSPFGTTMPGELSNNPFETSLPSEPSNPFASSAPPVPSNPFLQSVNAPPPKNPFASGPLDELPPPPPPTSLPPQSPFSAFNEDANRETDLGETEPPPPAAAPDRAEEAPKRKATLARATPLPDRTPQRTMEVPDSEGFSFKKAIVGILVLGSLGFGGYKLWGSKHGSPTSPPKAIGTLLVECKPEKIEINIDKSSKKPCRKGSSFELAPGNHTAEFTAKGYKKKVEKFTINLGQTTKVNVNLTKGKGKG